jgi:Mg2+ and Co2+ transporter CorA
MQIPQPVLPLEESAFAAAEAPSRHYIPRASVAPSFMLAQSIRDLLELKVRGALTDEEFNQAKRTMIDDAASSARSKDDAIGKGAESTTTSSNEATNGFMVNKRASLWIGPDHGAPFDLVAAERQPTSESSAVPSSCAKLHAAHTRIKPSAPAASEKRNQWREMQQVQTPARHKALLDQSTVKLLYFNSRGRQGETFSEVQLKEHEMRHSVTHPRSNEDPQANTTLEELQLYAELESRQTSSNSSCVELSLNWHWIDVVGRDEHNFRRQYDAVLANLTKEFGICPSFLVDREHTLVQPQIQESPENAKQFLICLRVATPKISVTDDSMLELTNRWLIVVDLNKKLVITIHRLDSDSFASLRSHWKYFMSHNDIAFEEFLLKILDDAVDTYRTSLEVHSKLLDLCETKLMQSSKNVSLTGKRAESDQGHYSHLIAEADMESKILQHFVNRSKFLDSLLEPTCKTHDKSDMNSFLYHLHRRSSVQHRLLTIMEKVLSSTFTRLRLCSKQHAAQMCMYCTEQASHAQEVRDDAQHLLNMHISLQSFRTNELMAMLTKISIIFTPLAFLAGVYGMNFDMPEYHIRDAYPLFWCVCIVIAILSHYIFSQVK